MTNKQLTGYPSIDKPWLKYYSKDKLDMPSPDMSMYDFLYENNKQYLNNIALNYFGKKITYKELFNNIDKVASALQAIGINKGDIVSLVSLNTPEFVYLLYGLNKIGAVCNWLGLTSPEQDLHEQLSSTKSKVIFTIDVAYETIKNSIKNTSVEKIIIVPIWWSMPFILKSIMRINNSRYNNQEISWKSFLYKGNDIVNKVDINPSDMAMIEYTGGSTGIPKGCKLSSKNLNSYYINFLEANNNGHTNYHNRDKFLACVPLFLGFGVSSCLHGPLCHSMELLLAPDPSPEALGKFIIKYKPNHMASGRVQIDGLTKMVKNKKIDLSFLNSVMYGGEAKDNIWEKETEDTLNKNNFNAKVLNGYGMTETSAAILITPIDNPVGLIPLYNVNTMITDPEDSAKEYGYDTEGELCLSSDTIMIGYYQKTDETSGIIFEKKGKQWVKTQDLAKISKDGIIQITGRIKRIYHKLSPENVGIRVYPMRIEDILSRYPVIEKCAVIGIKDDKTAYKTIAYLVLKETIDNSDTFKKEVDKYCKDNLPESHIPDEYVFVDKFPINRAGKVDYQKLERLAQEEISNV